MAVLTLMAAGIVAGTYDATFEIELNGLKIL